MEHKRTYVAWIVPHHRPDFDTGIAKILTSNAREKIVLLVMFRRIFGNAVSEYRVSRRYLNWAKDRRGNRLVLEQVNEGFEAEDLLFSDSDMAKRLQQRRDLFAQLQPLPPEELRGQWAVEQAQRLGVPLSRIYLALIQNGIRASRKPLPQESSHV